MDANGLVSFQIADADGFGFGRPAGTAPADLHWDPRRRLLRLDRLQAAPALAEDETFARTQAEKPSPVRDPAGSWAFWDAEAGRIAAGGFGPGTVPLPVPPDEAPGVPRPTDMAFAEDVLYVARNGAVVMVDRRERWRPARVSLGGFEAHRLAPAPGGGVWALDRAAGRIARLTGRPLRTTGLSDRDEGRFRREPNPDPPRLRLITRARVPADLHAVAIAASPGGRLALVAWQHLDDAVLMTLEDGSLVRRFALAGLRFPYGLAWQGEEAVAVLASDGAAPAAQAYVYELDVPPSDTLRQRPQGAVYRLLEPWHGGFFNAPAPVPAYPVAGEAPDRPGGVRPLHPLSRATHARTGSVTLAPLDSGAAGCVWHRLCIEAAIPARTGLRVWAFASDDPGLPPPPGADGEPGWAPHVAGEATLPDVPDAACAAWLDERSEFPYSPGLLPCAREPGRAGLFTVLLQRPGRAVRRVRGQYLFLHLELLGDSRKTPEIAAIRAYPKRFSYRDRYLPDLYGETLSGSEGDAEGGATAPDFLDRFLGLFEGALTALEDKVAASWLLTDPAGAPEEALPWLARWIGLDPGLAGSGAELRETLVAAPWSARLHGTMAGILAALELATGGRTLTGRVDPHGAVPRPGEIALASRDGRIVKALVLHAADPAGGLPSVFLTGGAVSRGEIVAVEGFRLRRTFATILGADLADEDDPLTLGLAASGNSFVGDTLILGDETRREFLALFEADLPLGARDRRAVGAFLERLAHRLMVLVRRSPRTENLTRLRDIVAREAPAHVGATVLPASRPLIVAAASLVGIDTFLTEEPEPAPVRLGRSPLGLGDRVHGAGQLDPRADGPVPMPPSAAADGPAEVSVGTEFVLSAARSRAAPGRRIVRNIWMWN